MPASQPWAQYCHSGVLAFRGACNAAVSLEKPLPRSLIDELGRNEEAGELFAVLWRQAFDQLLSDLSTPASQPVQDGSEKHISRFFELLRESASWKTLVREVRERELDRRKLRDQVVKRVVEWVQKAVTPPISTGVAATAFTLGTITIGYQVVIQDEKVTLPITLEARTIQGEPAVIRYTTEWANEEPVELNFTAKPVDVRLAVQANEKTQPVSIPVMVENRTRPVVIEAESSRAQKPIAVPVVARDDTQDQLARIAATISAGSNSLRSAIVGLHGKEAGPMSAGLDSIDKSLRTLTDTYVAAVANEPGMITGNVQALVDASLGQQHKVSAVLREDTEQAVVLPSYDAEERRLSYSTVTTCVRDVQYEKGGLKIRISAPKEGENRDCGEPIAYGRGDGPTFDALGKQWQVTVNSIERRAFGKDYAMVTFSPVRPKTTNSGTTSPVAPAPAASVRADANRSVEQANRPSGTD